MGKNNKRADRAKNKPQQRDNKAPQGNSKQPNR
jgi:hypothetical protein